MSVYFMSHGGLVKIGKSSDPESRLKALQTAAFMRIRLLAVADIASEARSYEVERKLHEQFAWSRKRGEYFAMTRPLRNLIAAVAAGMDVCEAMSLCAKECRRMAGRAHLLKSSKLTTPPVAENSSRRRKRLREEQRAAQR